MPLQFAEGWRGWRLEGLDWRAGWRAGGLGLEGRRAGGLEGLGPALITCNFPTGAIQKPKQFDHVFWRLYAESIYEP